MEFSETISYQLTDGECLTPTLHDALLEASKTTRDERNDFARILCREHDSLQTIEAELASIGSRLEEPSQQIAVTSESEELACIEEALDQIDQQCADLATRRQDMIHGRSISTFSGIDEQSLVHYLYAELETATPALFKITHCLDSIRRQRMRCLR